MSRRLDLELVSRGLARSRTRAAALVRAGTVLVDGVPALRASHQVGAGTTIEVRAQEGRVDWITRGWVGRGATKLDHALRTWHSRGLDVAGRRCLDAGASTGGFTQVLLEHGAARVVAVDVGHGQLDPTIATDPRVVDRSGTSIRDIGEEGLGGPCEVVVADLSFISLRLVLPVLPALSVPGAEVVLLVKPQFEVGRRRLGKGGVVRSATVRTGVLTDLDDQARRAGLGPVDVIRSPVTGGTGNIEYLWWLRRCRTGMMDCGVPAAQMAERYRALRREESG